MILQTAKKSISLDSKIYRTSPSQYRPLRQLIHGGFLHPQCNSAMSCFLQQRLAELLGLVIGKSQARASLNMTVLVRLVILYRASFGFARGAGENSLIIINLRVKKSAKSRTLLAEKMFYFSSDAH